MSKTDESPKREERTPRPRTPVAMAEEAVKASDTLNRSLPPSISLDGVSSESVINSVNEIMMKKAFTKLQQNTVDSALLESERQLEEQQRKLDSERAGNKPPTILPTVTSPLLGQVGGVGGLLHPIASTDRAALLDAALKNLHSDDAKIKFMQDHPKLLSSSPMSLPGMQQHDPYSPTLQVAPPTALDSMAMLREAVSMVADQMRAGMDIQRAISGSPQNSPSVTPPIEATKIVETFKEIVTDTNKSYSELFKAMQEQNRKIQEDNAKALADLQQKNIDLQMDVIKQDKGYMQTRLQQLEDALRAPRQVSVDELRGIIQQSRENGIPVNMDTPDQERIRAEIIREDKKLDHALSLEDKKLDLELTREKRRTTAFESVAGILGGAFESQVLKKHPLSEAGASVAGRF